MINKMAKTYSMEFRLEAYDFYLELKREGITYPNGVQVKNVRDLLTELGISSYTLYEWIPQMESYIEKEGKEAKESEIPYQANIPKENGMGGTCLLYTSDA